MVEGADKDRNSELENTSMRFIDLENREKGLTLQS
jgi:hypothetical protein